MFGLKIVPRFDKIEGRSLTEDEIDELTEGINKVTSWIVSAAHWIATFQTIDLLDKKRGKPFYVSDMWSDYSQLSYYWTTYYGRYYLNLDIDDSDLFDRFNPKDWQSLCVINNRSYHKFEFLAYLGEELEDVVKHFLPRIKQKNGLRLCEIPAHIFDKSGEPHYGRIPRICYRIGNSWICEDCVETYNLEEQVMPPLPAKRQSHFKTEWEKMKPKRRLEILKRDNFTCQKCQRSPLKEYGVKLKVTHIVAVTDGGKTKPDNLQTLCADCLEGETGE
jgi:hypothetical protein